MFQSAIEDSVKKRCLIDFLDLVWLLPIGLRSSWSSSSSFSRFMISFRLEAETTTKVTTTTATTKVQAAAAFVRVPSLQLSSVQSEHVRARPKNIRCWRKPSILLTLLLSVFTAIIIESTIRYTYRLNQVPIQTSPFISRSLLNEPSGSTNLNCH